MDLRLTRLLLLLCAFLLLHVTPVTAFGAGNIGECSEVSSRNLYYSSMQHLSQKLKARIGDMVISKICLKRLLSLKATNGQI